MVRTNSFSRDGFITKGELKLANKNSSMKEITQVTKHLRPGITPCRKVEEPVLVIKNGFKSKYSGIILSMRNMELLFQKIDDHDLNFDKRLNLNEFKKSGKSS